MSEDDTAVELVLGTTESLQMLTHRVTVGTNDKPAEKRQKVSLPSSLAKTVSIPNDVHIQLETLWTQSTTTTDAAITASDHNKEEEDKSQLEKAYHATLILVTEQVEELIRSGLDAFHGWDRCDRDLRMIKHDLEGKNGELVQIRASDDKNRTTISNLLAALDKTRTNMNDYSHFAIAEAGLRAELSIMVTKRDEALIAAEEWKRKADILHEDNHQIKMKLSKAKQELLKMERDHRMAMSLAKSLDNHSSSDLDYYKRKNMDLVNQMQSMNAIVANKNRQIDELRRQIERNMSQNRLAKLRRESEPK